ncbi:MAG: MOSC N-terminal beta barrel domain-containing protein [Rubrivivax sp.]|jgi:uncharacterized protein YcbX|nr:MOSC N-terminal beta barrel domain-containing protein [Rubrivivax sp.]
MTDTTARIAQLFVHPVKSCAGIEVTDALLVETGPDLDRQWMVVDERGDMLTQRSLPRMALIRTTFRHEEVVLRAPGMLALHLAVDRVEAPTRVRVWDDEVAAYDMGPLAAQWCTDFLGRPARLARFDPEQRRLSNKRWTGDLDAENGFADAFPLLVTGSASLAELNRRLAATGHATVDMRRFRPNLVLDGLEPFDEDHLDELHIDTADGEVVLRLVKPCVRCTVPSVDPDSGEQGHAVADVLSTFRADARMDGGITFGMNAVIVDGIDRTLRVGQAVRGTYRF